MFALLFFQIWSILVLLVSFIYVFTPSVADAVVQYLTSEKPISHAILFGVYAVVLGPSAFLYGLLGNPRWLIPTVTIFLAIATAITVIFELLN